MEKTQAKPLTAAQQRQRDKKRRTWLRAGVQLFFFVSMPGAFVAGFSGVKQIFLHQNIGHSGCFLLKNGSGVRMNHPHCHNCKTSHSAYRQYIYHTFLLRQSMQA